METVVLIKIGINLFRQTPWWLKLKWFMCRQWVLVLFSSRQTRGIKLSLNLISSVIPLTLLALLPLPPTVLDHNATYHVPCRDSRGQRVFACSTCSACPARLCCAQVMIHNPAEFWAKWAPGAYIIVDSLLVLEGSILGGSPELSQ